MSEAAKRPNGRDEQSLETENTVPLNNEQPDLPPPPEDNDEEEGVVSMLPKPPGGFYRPQVDGGKFDAPHGYVLGRFGTYMLKEEEAAGEKVRTLQQIADQPVWIERLMEGMDAQDFSLVLATLRNGKVVRVTVGREKIATDSKIVSLSGSGFPMYSHNARMMSIYLARAEADNRSQLPQAETTNKMGWRDTGEFVLGRQVFSPHGIREVLPSPNADPMWFDRIGKGGTEREWMEILPIVMKYPKVFIGLLAAHSSVLLKRIGCPGYCIEWYDQTSVGKTTTLRVAASAFGPTDDDDLPSWGSTAFAIEARAAFQNNLPFLADETKTFSGKPEDQARAAYMLAGGQGKNRGNQDLMMRAAMTWWLASMWTGEHSVRTMTKDSGILPRVLSFPGPPMGKKGVQEGADADKLTELVSRNYGHSGERFVRFLMKRDEQGWEKMRSTYEASREIYMKAAPADCPPNLVRRWSKSFGALRVTALILGHLYGAKWDKARAEEALMEAWVMMCEESSGSMDYAEAALDVVKGWISGNPHSFRGDPQDKECWGRRCYEGMDIVASRLRKFLKAEGYDDKVVLNAWAEKKWVLVDAKGKAKEVGPKVNGTTLRCIRLLDAALDHRAEGVEEPLPDSPNRRREIDEMNELLDSQVPPPDDDDLPWEDELDRVLGR